jgi:hypothetical protein
VTDPAPIMTLDQIAAKMPDSRLSSRPGDCPLYPNNFSASSALVRELLANTGSIDSIPSGLGEG